MRVVTAEVPVGRVTRIEFTDRELQDIEEALQAHEPGGEEPQRSNFNTWNQIDDILTDLNIPRTRQQ